MHEVWSQEPHCYRVLLDEKCLSCKTEVYLLLSIVQWELSLVWSSGFFNETVRSPFTQGHSGVFRFFGSLYFTVCKNRYTHSLIIPQYSVGSSAVIKAKRDGSLFKFFVQQLWNPSHTSKYRKSPIRPFFSRTFSLEVLYSSKTTVLCCRILTSWTNMALNIVSTARSDLCFTSILEAILNQEFNKSGKIQLCQAPTRYEIRQYLIFLSLWRSFGAAKAGGIQSFKLDQVCWCGYCKMVVYSFIAVWVKSWGYKEGCWVCLEVPGRRCQISW